MTSLIVRVDATHDKGLAHAARTGRLLDLLPVRPELHVVGDGAPLKRLFRNAKVYPAGRNAGKVVLALAQETGAEAVLIDEPDTDPKLWAALETAPHLQRLVIDDFGSAIPADLVINGTVIDQYHAYPNLRDGGQALCGAQYALVSPDFAGARDPEASRVGPVVAVCGGGDRAAAWAMQLAEHGQALCAPNPFLLIVGDAYPDFDALKETAWQNGVLLKQGLPPHQLAGHLARTPAAILTGGMIVYEALAAGAPVLAFPQLENLKQEIAWFEARGGLINLGFEAGDDLDALKALLQALIADDARAQALAQTGPTLIDGAGMTRAASAIAARLGLTKS